MCDEDYIINFLPLMLIYRHLEIIFITLSSKLFQSQMLI